MHADNAQADQCSLTRLSAEPLAEMRALQGCWASVRVQVRPVGTQGPTLHACCVSIPNEYQHGPAGAQAGCCERIRYIDEVHDIRPIAHSSRPQVEKSHQADQQRQVAISFNSVHNFPVPLASGTWDPGDIFKRSVPRPRFRP